MSDNRRKQEIEEADLEYLFETGVINSSVFNKRLKSIRKKYEHMHRQEHSRRVAIKTTYYNDDIDDDDIIY